MKSKSVGVRSIYSSIHCGLIDNENKLDEEIDAQIADLEAERAPMKEIINKRNSCAHSEYKPSTYTTQRRLMGHARVNSRICIDCSQEETYQENMDAVGDVDRPAWALDATERYYNNDF